MSGAVCEKCRRGRAAGRVPSRSKVVTTARSQRQRMSSGAQIRWRIMRVSNDGQIGNVRLCVALCGLMTSGSLLASTPSRACTTRTLRRINLGVGRKHQSCEYPPVADRLSEEPGQNGHEFGVHAGLGHKARAKRSGSKRAESLRPGDPIKLRYIPVQRQTLGFLKSMTPSDGRVINISAGKPND